MHQLKSLLGNLLRPNTTEVALVTGRNPCAKVAGTYEIIDHTVLSTDEIVMMLLTAAGARHVDNLGPKPLQWGCRVDGVGAVAVAAVRNGDVVQARFTRVQPDAPRKEMQPAVLPKAAAIVPPSDPTRPVPPPGPTKPGAPPAELLWNDLDEETAPAPPPKAQAKTTAEAIPSLDVELDHGLTPAPAPPAAPAAKPAGKNRPFAATLDDPADPMLFGLVQAGSRVAVDSLDDILQAAREAGASDLHLVAGRPPLFRVSGKLLPRGNDAITPEALERMMAPKIPDRLRSQLAHDGSCDFALDDAKTGRLRVNMTRQRTGLKASFRLITPEIPTLAGLGLPDSIALATRHHQGLIVLTGPTGHGKTTTLAAIVDIINSETSHHVITVEDPIEYVHPRKKAMMSQREVGTNTRSFQAALKGSLREDPDVIVVGELRDTETVRMALSASETGHLVLGTMNTPSAAKTIDRLIDLFPPADQQQVRVTLAGGLRLVVSQRLLPRKDGPGMVVAAEMLPGSVPLWNLIRESKTWQIPSLQQRGKGFGIIRLDDSLADLVRAGKVSLEDAMAVAEAPEEFEANVAGKKPAAPAPQAAAAPAPQEAAKAPEAEPQKGLLGRAGALFGKKGGA